MDGMSPLRPSALVETVDQAISIKYNNLVYDLEATGHDIITLSLGESFFDVPAPDFGDFEPGELHHYSHSRGLPELRRRLAKYYGDEFGLPVDPDHEILITAGSKVAIYLALLATVEPGDEVVVLEPSWLSYPTQVWLCGGVPVSVPHDVGVFELDRYVTSRTRAIIVNNPNNPSGRVYTAAELGFLHELAERHGLLLVVDEAYNEFVPPGTRFVTCGAADPDKQHTLTINSMSKNYGISGWRVGYVIAHRTLIEQILKVNQHLITCAPTPLTRYLAEHFDTLIERTRPQIQDVVATRNEVAGWLAERGIEVLPGSATFYLFASLGNSTLGSDAFAERLLRESGVSVVPGIAYGESCDHYIRISVGTETPERIRRGIDAIARLIENTGG
ncbi:pyridoxal phosphate-dependent aminotransferase [Amycolatopsis sp. NPDC058986]|uniref:pyridoxal phosphate-dependent aminotransferase n=1 Tax=unclassified Amycolatopsis TaxID=2618356 RepID=UPI00366D0E62